MVRGPRRLGNAPVRTLALRAPQFAVALGFLARMARAGPSNKPMKLTFACGARSLSAGC